MSYGIVWQMYFHLCFCERENFLFKHILLVHMKKYCFDKSCIWWNIDLCKFGLICRWRGGPAVLVLSWVVKIQNKTEFRNLQISSLFQCSQLSSRLSFIEERRAQTARAFGSVWFGFGQSFMYTLSEWATVCRLELIYSLNVLWIKEMWKVFYSVFCGEILSNTRVGHLQQFVSLQI